MVPVRESSRSARVDLPWSMWATIEKLRIRSMAIRLRITRRGRARPAGRFRWGNPQAAQKGPAARRRPRAAREAYSVYVERAAEGAVPPQMGPFQQPARRVV